MTADGKDGKYLEPGQTPPAQPLCQNGFCTRWSADGTVRVQVSSSTSAPLPNDEMIKILNGIRLVDTASVTDDSTWVDAVTAVPASR